MIKKLLLSLIPVCLIGGLLWSQTVSGTTISGPATATPAGFCTPGLLRNSSDIVNVVLRDITVTTGNSFLPLPGNVATVDGGVVLQDDLTFVITDVFMVNESGADINLVRAEQVGGAFDVLLSNEPAQLSWQSSVGLRADSDESLGAGVALRKHNQADPDATVDIVFTGFATTR